MAIFAAEMREELAIKYLADGLFSGRRGEHLYGEESLFAVFTDRGVVTLDKSGAICLPVIKPFAALY